MTHNRQGLPASTGLRRGTPDGQIFAVRYCVVMVGGHMGNPNPMKQAYTCQTCGEPRPPYQFYCDRHIEDGERNDKPLLIDRIMQRMFGRS